MEKFYLLTFENTISAMTAEENLKKNQISLVIMPTPTYITKSCGISIRIHEDDLQKAIKLEQQNVIKIKAIFLKDGSEYFKVQN